MAPVYFFYTWYVAGFGKNALTGDGCCWHAQHGVCHRTKNQITGLTFCSPTYGTRWAAYQRLSHVLMIKLQLHRVSLSRHHVGRSHNASRVELCSNRQLWRFCRITWRSGRESMSHRSMSSSMTATMFHRRSHLLIFMHDTYSGTNGRLTLFVGVGSNAISLNLGSTMVATQVRSRDVTAFAN